MDKQSNSIPASSNSTIVGQASADEVRRQKINASRQEVFDIVCEMEGPLWTVHDLIIAMGIMAPELEGDDAVAALQRLLVFAKQSWKSVEELRGKLFHMTHPRSEELVKGGAN